MLRQIPQARGLPPESPSACVDCPPLCRGSLLQSELLEGGEAVDHLLLSNQWEVQVLGRWRTYVFVCGVCYARKCGCVRIQNSHVHGLEGGSCVWAIPHLGTELKLCTEKFSVVQSRFS